MFSNANAFLLTGSEFPLHLLLQPFPEAHKVSAVAAEVKCISFLIDVHELLVSLPSQINSVNDAQTIKCYHHTTGESEVFSFDLSA